MRGFSSARAAIVGLLVTSTAFAGGTGDPVGARARSAWDRGDWQQVETLYKEALDVGGLSPNAALEAYVRLGSAEALLKKRDAALVAFRHAALLQPRFTLAPVARAKAAKLAALAKKQEAKIGAFHLGAEVPENVAAAVPLQVGATLDPDHAAILSKVAATATDASANQVFHQAEPANTEVNFTIPGSALVAGATLTVRIDALDVHDNRMASVERLVHVSSDGASPAVAPVAGEVATNGGASTAAKATVQAPEVLLADPKPIPATTSETDNGKSFWSRPWPYVIAGAALAAGGVATYLVTRPSDQVTVGAARIDAR